MLGHGYRAVQPEPTCRFFAEAGLQLLAAPLRVEVYRWPSSGAVRTWIASEPCPITDEAAPLLRARLAQAAARHDQPVGHRRGAARAVHPLQAAGGGVAARRGALAPALSLATTQMITTARPVQEPDDSIDKFSREVRQKAELERAWRRQRVPTYKQRVSTWLADNVMVVDDAGDWCGSQHNTLPTPPTPPTPPHERKQHHHHHHLLYTAMTPAPMPRAGWRAGTSSSPAWASATCAPPPASTLTPPPPTRWR